MTTRIIAPMTLARSSHPSASCLILALLVGLFLAAPASAQSSGATSSAQGPNTPSFGSDFQAVAKRLDHRLVSLAEAIPAGRYTWRPAEGVRSVSEVLMHVAQINFGSARAVGMALPTDLPQDLSTVTDKAEVLRVLRTSFQLAEGATKALAAADFSQQAPGGGMTLGGAMLSYAEHVGEHLGQLIAYGRGLGVTPPWSR